MSGLPVSRPLFATSQVQQGVRTRPRRLGEGELAASSEDSKEAPPSPMTSVKLRLMQTNGTHRVHDITCESALHEF